MKWRRHRDAQPGHQRAGPGRHLAGRLAAARLPRRRARVSGCRCCATVVAELPDAQREPLTEMLDTLERADLGALQERLRRHLRRHPQVLAAPDLLHPGRHPPSRGGARRVQAGLPQGRRRVRHRRRAARPPLRGARVRRRAGLGHRLAPAHPAPGRHRGAQGRSRAARLAVAAGRAGAALDPARARRRRPDGPACGSSPRARRRRRSGSSRTPSTPGSTPAPTPSTPPRCSARRSP